MQPSYRIPNGFPNAKNKSTDGLGIIYIRGLVELLGFRLANRNVKSIVESKSITTIEEGGEEINKTTMLPIPIKIRKVPFSYGILLGGIHLSSARRLTNKD